MPGQADEQAQQHLLLLVESAQRAGRSESEIDELVDDALKTDDELDRAA